MVRDKFATAINCIDGRAQIPVIEWIIFNHSVQYVDMITEPGVDNILSSRSEKQTAAIANKLQTSIRVHQSNLVAIVGHFDCIANPVSSEEHLKQIKESAKVIGSWNYGIRVVGLFVNEWSSVDLLFDSNESAKSIKSFL